MTRREVVDGVVVVGAGPAGLTLAATLDAAGVPTLLLERAPGLEGASHASTFHPTSLDLLDRLGVADALVSRGLPVGELEYRHLTDDTVVRLSYDTLVDDTRFPFRLQCEQSELRPLLLERLRRGGRARVAFDSPVTEVAVGDGALLTVGGADPRTIETPIVVGADGAHSAMRHALEVDFEGSPYRRPLLRVMTDPAVRDLLPELGPVTYMADDRGSMSLLTLPDHVRLAFRIDDTLDDEAACDPDHVRGHLERLVVDPGAVPLWAIQRIAIHQRLASTFAVGPAFLVGDAAHLNDPSGGMGMNSGIHDAALLGLLLGRHVREGVALAEVTEAMTRRREVVRDRVIAAAEGHRTRLDRGGARWIASMAEVAADPERTRAFLRRSSMFESLPDELA